MILHVLHAVLWAAALSALVASAWTDLKDRIIPNELAGLVAISGIGLSLVLRPEQTWISLLAAFAVLIAMGVIAHYGMMGGGDVKLIGASALLVPPTHLGQLLVFIALAGGLLSCGYLAARYAVARGDVREAGPSAGASLDGGQHRQGWLSIERGRIAAGGPMPYALAIVAGVAATIAGELPQCLFASFCSF